jgi:small conductance mechanosensitive channel
LKQKSNERHLNKHFVSGCKSRLFDSDNQPEAFGIFLTIYICCQNNKKIHSQLFIQILNSLVMDTSNLFQDASTFILAYGPKIVIGLLTLLIGLWIINWVTKLLDLTMTRRGMESSVRSFLSSLVSVGSKVMLLLSVAGTFGLQTTSFIAIFTALAFAIGTALSGSMGHFASGVLLLIFRPYKVGDLVTLAGQTGTVKDLQVFNTVLLTPDNKTVIIPNGTVTSGTIVNISGAGEIRVDMTFSTSSDADIDQVRRVIQNVADASPLILKTPAIDIFVNNNPVGMTEFAVRPWCKSDHFWDVYFYMQENVKKAFIAANIPAPKQGIDIKMVS